MLKSLVKHSENIAVHIILGGAEKKECADHPAKIAGAGPNRRRRLFIAHGRFGID